MQWQYLNISLNYVNPLERSNVIALFFFSIHFLKLLASKALPSDAELFGGMTCPEAVGLKSGELELEHEVFSDLQNLDEN